jgi:hypothetical protein
MGMGFSVLGWLAGIVSLVCFILVIIAMFQNQQGTLAIVCLVLLLCGIGFLIAFIFGWIRSGEWGITKIMMIWTGAIIVGIICNIVAGALGAGFSSFSTI